MADTDIITSEGEIIEPGAVLSMDDGAMSTLARAEINSQIATARQYPRSMKAAMNRLVERVTLDETSAEEAMYALKRGGKPVRGPSIRLAEAVAQVYGNCRIDARVISIDRVNKLLTAEGMFHDLETNMATRATAQRRISDKSGRIFNEDMIAVTAAAACSIARRNAILSGVPKAVWRKGVEAAEDVIRGDVKTLAERRSKAIAALAHFNLSGTDIFAILEVNGEEEIGLDDLVTLRTMWSNLKNGETTAEQLLAGTKAAKPDHKVVPNALADTAPTVAAQGGEAAAATDPVPAGADAASGQDKPRTGKADEPAPAVDPEAIEKARQRGREAAVKNLPRRAMPAEFRDDARKAEADAWLAGYDTHTNEGE